MTRIQVWQRGAEGAAKCRGCQLEGGIGNSIELPEAEEVDLDLERTWRQQKELKVAELQAIG